MRIREQRKNTDSALPDQPTQDLLDSLALGPIIVRGHFDHDFKRFGEQFACGDAQARENMKDVLINLQMTLIIALRSSGMDLTDLDFDALQSASDDCRVNAGVCLGQLSQRLSDSAKAQAMYPIYANAPLPPLPSLAYSSSRSTHSSGYGPRTPSDNVSDRFTTLSMSTASTTRRSTGKSRKRTTGSIGSDSQSPPPVKQPVQPPVPRIATDNFGRLPAQNDADQDMAEALSMRRPSSHTLSPEDSELLSADADDGPPPRNPARSPPTQEVQRESYISSGPHSQTSSPPNISRVPSSHQKEIHRDRYGPEDFTPVATTRSMAFPTSTEMYRVEHDEEPAPASYSARARETNHSTLEHIQYLQQNSRPPRTNVNLFPTPPPRQQLPQPPFQSRNESLQQRAQPSQSADPLSRFPQPKKRTPPPLSSFQTMPTTSRPATSSSLPADAAPPPRQQPPPIPQFSANRNVNDSSTSLSGHAATLGIHQIHHSPSINSTTSLPSNSHANSSTLNTQSTDTSRPPTSLSNHPTTTATLTMPLTLPNDKYPLGFCKSATRLLLSPASDPKHSKAFQVANRPVGFNSMVPYWGCRSCQFEGPVSTIVNVEDTGGGKKGIFGKSSSKKGREEKVFDSKVRISPGGGVRYVFPSFLVYSTLSPYSLLLSHSPFFKPPTHTLSHPPNKLHDTANSMP